MATKLPTFSDSRIRVDYRGRHRLIEITFAGQTLSASRWGAKLGISGDVILMRLRNNMSLEQALGVGRYKRKKYIRVAPIQLDDGVCPELAAMAGLIDADQYLDFYNVPRGIAPRELEP